MVGIAQLAERLVVVQEVAGSSPVTHPTHDEGPEKTLRAFIVKWALLLVFVFRLKRIARRFVKRVSDVEFARDVACLHGVVTEN